MAAEWSTGRLGDCVVLQSEGTPSKSRSDFWVGIVPWVSAKDMKSYWIEDTEDHLSEQGAEEATRIVPEGTTLLLVRGMTLHNDIPICRVRRPAAFNQDVKAVLAREGTDPEFVPYLLLGNKAKLLSSVDSAGHGTGRLNSDTLLNLPVRIPPLQKQHAIAHILGALDDKIELNRRMNETLEAMARAIFKSWFVDFDPVRAKAEGRDPGLPKRIVDLFPNLFEDSELGEIPKGWAVMPLRDLASYLSRGVGPAYVEADGICVLNQKCIRDRRVDFSRARRHDPSKKSTEGRTLRLLDILVNSTGVGTLGRIAQLWNLPESAIIDSHVTVIRAAKDVDPWFLGISLIGREADVEALAEGSTGQTELSRTRLGELTCLVPAVELQASFGKLVGPLLSRLSVNEQTSITLAALRDTLLPKLISGELRVNDFERSLERIV